MLVKNHNMPTIELFKRRKKIKEYKKMLIKLTENLNIKLKKEKANKDKFIKPTRKNKDTKYLIRNNIYYLEKKIEKLELIS